MLGRRRLLRVTFPCPAEPRSPQALHSTTPPLKLLLEDRTQLDHAYPEDLSTAELRLCRHLRGRGQDALTVFPVFHKAAHPKAIVGSSAEVSFKPESTREAGCQRTRGQRWRARPALLKACISETLMPSTPEMMRIECPEVWRKCSLLPRLQEAKLPLMTF